MTARSGKVVVGSIVRAKRGTKRCRAMVATVGNDGRVAATAEHEDAFCVMLWEPVYPERISSRFLVTPKSIHKETEQHEVTVKVESVEGLLPFETNSRVNSDDSRNDSDCSIAMWKERGDQLLRLGDASAAATYYEKALFDSSSVSIGGTIVVSVEGFPRIAEVDCVDDEEIDVTLVHNQEEKTLKESSVLLAILEDDPTKLQERILLNLARCMLQLSDLDAANRPRYLKSAVLASTLAISVSSFRKEHGDAADEQPLRLPANAQTALMLRCKAYSGLSRWAMATSDARKLLKSGRDEQQGRKLLVSIERKKNLQSKADKRLAKEICLLVQSATAASESTTTADHSSTPSVSSSKPSVSSASTWTANERNNNTDALVLCDDREKRLHNGSGESSRRNEASGLLTKHKQQATNPRSNFFGSFPVSYILVLIVATVVSHYFVSNG